MEKNNNNINTITSIAKADATMKRSVLLRLYSCISIMAQIIKIAGVGAVLAKSFARIFYRNAINIGLLAIECDTDGIDAGDELDLDIKAGTLKNLTKGTTTMIEPLPDVMIKLLEDGGLIEHIKKNGDLVLG